MYQHPGSFSFPAADFHYMHACVRRISSFVVPGPVTTALPTSRASLHGLEAYFVTVCGRAMNRFLSSDLLSSPPCFVLICCEGAGLFQIDIHVSLTGHCLV